jgi:hypothetical protein
VVLWNVTDIIVGNNETMSSVSKGHYKGLLLQKKGTSVDITLQDVLYIPKPMVNLLSLTKAIENMGVALSSKGPKISLSVGQTEKSIPLQVTLMPLHRLRTSMLDMK